LRAGDAVTPDAVARNRAFVERLNRPLTERGERTAVSLFSGILGIEIALGRLGFSTRYAIDLDPVAKAVKDANARHLGTFPYVAGDLRSVEPQEILEVAGLEPGELTILTGGPPCQPFSKSGGRSGVLDERGRLFARYLDYLDVLRPQAFVLENVRGMVSSRGGADFRLILDAFDESGYTLYWKVVDAANYGVPQFRQRLFLVGFRERIRFAFPRETHGSDEDTEQTLFSDVQPFVTAGDAIRDLAGVVAPPPYSGQFAHLLSAIPPGLNYSYYTAERGHPQPIFGWRSKYWYFLLKGHPERPSLTVQAQPGNNTGPFHWDGRRFAVEELRRLQSFPDWLSLDVPYYVAHRLIGNAVPPLLAEAIGASVADALDGRELISKTDYLAARAAATLRVRSGSGAGKGKAKLDAPLAA